jgi:hypothetical protein
MKLLRDRRFRHLPSFKGTRDREVQNFLVIAALLGAIVWLATVTIANLLRDDEGLQLRSTIGWITPAEVRDAG